MISGLVLVIIIEGILSGSDLIPLNTAIEGVIVSMRTPLLTDFFVLVTRIANPFIISCVAVLLATFLIFKKKSYDAVLFLTGLIVATVSMTVLKNVFQITRPVSEVYQADGWSFPSGHATIATAFFFLLAYVLWGKMNTNRRKAGLLSLSIVGPILICFSRLYLGAHWALDVLAGVALGLLSVSFTILMFNIFLSHRRSIRKMMDL